MILRFHLLPTLALLAMQYCCLNAVTHYSCEGYDYQMLDGMGEYFCIIFRDSIDPNGANFTEALEICDAHGESLPIITSDVINVRLGDYLLKTDTYWIGIICNYETDHWMWEDHQRLLYDNLEPGEADESCSDSDKRFTYRKMEFSGHKEKWHARPADMRIPGKTLCMKRATLSTPEPTDMCDEGWYLIDGFCYLIQEAPYIGQKWHLVNDYCASLGATLPVILSEEQNERLYVETAQYSGDPKNLFWIGIACKNDEISWIDGSPYTYSRFRTIDTPCRAKQGYYYSTDSFWYGPEDENTPTVMAVCSKNASLHTTTEDSKTTVFETTSKYPPTLSTITAEDIQTTDHSQTETTFEHTTKLTTATLSTTTARINAVSVTIWEIALIAIGSIAFFGLFIAIIVCVRRCSQTKRAKTIEMRLYSEKNTKVTTQAKALRYYDLPRKNDDWEIDRKFVSIDYMKMLGKGAFGSVFVGRVLTKHIPCGMERSVFELAALKAYNDFVAVKMLNETADAITERNFCAEIEIMKKIGYHERLVNILACITQSEPILLITEHCTYGDLLYHMRQKRKNMLENPANLNELHIVTFKQQIIYAMQIAYGLEYLSSRGFIHRDIAARNIMVDHNGSCKIGDFGLCRAIGKEEQMYQSHGGNLPLKWMSPEAIENYLFSTASDVWAYGIVLFEIATLGGTPYADWAASETLPRLKQGHRMARPESCTEQFYEVMSDCWADSPTNRPTCSNLRKRLGVLLEDLNPNEYYLKLNAQAHYYVLESS